MTVLCSEPEAHFSMSYGVVYSLGIDQSKSQFLINILINSAKDTFGVYMVNNSGKTKKKCQSRKWRYYKAIALKPKQLMHTKIW